ncbi:adenosine receptor A2a-like [Clytia hemisphaerica]|uniref:G-protein coupled receptors family 1 profile domain-containing protein n=1 Tax=Clytia hemisphaerica TaxID=252671 RepID=A0A7M5ULU0_9CNID
MTSFDCGGVQAPKDVSIFSAVTSLLLCIIISIGNFLIIWVIYKDPLKKLRTPFTYFIVNLATADLIVGTITCPIYAYTLILESLGGLSDTMAQTMHMTFFISSTASILSLIALSLDRYIAIEFPFRYKLYFTGNRCRLITIVIWVLAISLSWIYMKVGYISHLMVFANSSIVIAFFIFIGTYFRAYRFLRQETQRYRQRAITIMSTTQEHLNRLNNERRVTRVFLTVLIVFLCTYCPATIMIYLLQSFPSWDCTTRHWIRDLVIFFITINSSVNPFVYTIRLKTFQTSLRLVLSRSESINRQDRHSSVSSSTVMTHDLHSIKRDSGSTLPHHL